MQPLALVLVFLSLAGPAPVTHGDWHWPVDPPRSVARPFIAPETRFGSGHRGIDIRGGPTLYAPADGVVRFAGVVVDRPVLSLDHGGGVVSSFEPVVALVAAGDAVSRGQLIGTVIAGHCATPCVHVGVRVEGDYVSPLAWFGGIPRSILLPTRWEAVSLAVTRARRPHEQSPTSNRVARGRAPTATWWSAPRHRPRSPCPATRTSPR